MGGKMKTTSYPNSNCVTTKSLTRQKSKQKNRDSAPAYCHSLMDQLLEIASSDNSYAHSYLIELFHSTQDLLIKKYILFLIGFFKLEICFDDLLNWIKHPNLDASVKEEGILCLSDFNKREGIPILLEEYQYHSSLKIKNAILLSLYQMDDQVLHYYYDDLLLLIRQSLCSNYPSIRRKAALLCSRIHDPTVISSLISLLKDPHRDVRSTAALSLSHYDYPNVHRALCLSLGDGDMEVVNEILKALYNLKVKGIEPLIAGLIIDNTPLSQRFPITYQYYRRIVKWKIFPSHLNRFNENQVIEQVEAFMEQKHNKLMQQLNLLLQATSDLPMFA